MVEYWLGRKVDDEMETKHEYFLFLRIGNEREQSIPIHELTRYKNTPGVDVSMAKTLIVLDSFTGSFPSKKAFLEYLNKDYTEMNLDVNDSEIKFSIKKDGKQYIKEAFFGEDYKLLQWQFLKQWFVDNRTNKDAIMRLVNSLTSKRQSERIIKHGQVDNEIYDRILLLLSNINNLSPELDELNTLSGLSYTNIRKIALYIRDSIEPMKIVDNAVLPMEDIPGIDGKKLTRDMHYTDTEDDA